MNKIALISVYDKTNLEELAGFLLNKNFSILSSGGTYNYLINIFKSENIYEISEYIDFPEILNGRVKTLHPKIYGGILANRKDDKHMENIEHNSIKLIDIVIVNLYPFRESILNKNSEIEDNIENIDIGGHSLIRASAKNYENVLVITDPNDYENVCENYDWIDTKVRKHFAAKAFQYIVEYDYYISNYFNKLCNLDNKIVRIYEKEKKLKYGCNPQQIGAGLYKNIDTKNFPFKILNGNLGYINVLDAIYGWNLVYELSSILNMPAAASYKHTSPAGSAISKPLSNSLKKVYLVENYSLSPLATAFIRARNADPKSSYGDFIALSHKVDVETAKLINVEVSDGIIAPDYSEEAYNILKKKKKGNYVILKMEKYERMDNEELRELNGIALMQDRNDKITDYKTLENIVSKNGVIPDEAKMDLILANTVLKYTQSNSVAIAYDGQCIGIGAGQQSRIDCVKLARKKAEVWFNRQTDDMINFLSSLGTMKRQEKINNVMQKIEEKEEIEKKKEKEEKNISLASDGFFPFPDNIDCASQISVRYIIQPGGSISDKNIIEKVNYYNMVMIFTGSNMRMFLH